MSKEEFVNLTKIMFEEQKIKEELDKLQAQNKELVLENMALMARLDELSFKLQKTEGEPEEEEIDFNDLVFEEEEKCEFSGYKGMLVKECRKFFKEVPFKQYIEDIKQYVIGQDTGLELILTGVFNYIKGIARDGVPP